MLAFSTEFPIDPASSTTEILNVLRAWIVRSPHTKITADDVADIGNHTEWSFTKENESIHALKSTLGGGVEAIAIRWASFQEGINWETAVVCSRQSHDCWIGIRTARESNNPATRLPTARKPFVVRKILDSFEGGLDGPIKLSQEPLFLMNDDIALAASLILGQAGCHLPIIYVSTGFKGEIPIEPAALAKELSGMAHVVVEPNRPFARRLQIEVNSENVYGGTIGIYWPNGSGRRSFFVGKNFDSDEIGPAIVEEIRQALLNRRPLARCSWSSVQETVSREAILALKSSGSNEVDLYVEKFDAELKAKAQQLDDAEKEIGRLGAEVRKYEARLSAQQDFTFNAGQERDLYAGETLEIVRDALKETIARVQAGSRRQLVLQSTLEAMPVSTAVSDMHEKLKQLLRDYRDMDNKTRKGLEELGFSIEEDGKHYKLRFLGDDRYVFALSKSGSDRRGGLNMVSDISKKLF